MGRRGEPQLGAVCVLGCGVIGASWATAFLEAGLQVRAWDPDPGAVLRAVSPGSHSKLVVTTTAAEAVAGADFVQESGPESLEVKRALYQEITPALSASSVVASSTSTLPPSLLQDGCAFAARALVGHPFNPPHILPLVEVVPGEATDAQTVERAMRFYRQIGKHPILLRRERPGHLANRLQAALWREAVDAVASGQASVADVDDAVRLSLGPRWALMGPFATFHLAGGKDGLAHFLDHLEPAFEQLWDDAHRPVMTEALKAKILAGVADSTGGVTTEEMSRDRDEKLKAILTLVARSAN